MGLLSVAAAQLYNASFTIGFSGNASKVSSSDAATLAALPIDRAVVLGLVSSSAPGMLTETRVQPPSAVYVVVTVTPSAPIRLGDTPVGIVAALRAELANPAAGGFAASFVSAVPAARLSYIGDITGIPIVPPPTPVPAPIHPAVTGAATIVVLGIVLLAALVLVVVWFVTRAVSRVPADAVEKLPVAEVM